MANLMDFIAAHQLGLIVLPNADGYQVKLCDLSQEGEVLVIEMGRRIVPIGQGVTLEEAQESLAGMLDLKLIEVRNQGQLMRIIPPQTVAVEPASTPTI
jgi:hypothetical protein